MIRVYVIVEGQTEESFVGDVLASSLWPNQVFLHPIILGPPGHKGGNTSFIRVKKDVVTQLKQDRAAYCSTMIDLYGMGRGYPGTPAPAGLSNLEKVRHIERAFKNDVVSELPDLRADVRFLPYLQLHEYEGLLFSDPPRFATGIGQPQLTSGFQTIRDAFATPEDINDNPNTAPSKRVAQYYRPYSKPIDGLRAAKAVGVARMKQECPHFCDWVTRLEQLGQG